MWICASTISMDVPPQAALVSMTSCSTRTRLNASGSSICRMWPTPTSVDKVEVGMRARRSCACASGVTLSLSPSRLRPDVRPAISGFLEVDPLGHRQVLEIAAQAIEPHLGGAQPDPLAPPENPTASRLRAVGGGHRETDGATEVDPVRPVVERDQHRQRVGRAGPPARGLCHGLRRLARELARRRFAVEADPGE